ncbi:U-box domain-containing protein 30-like [Iris pallida]|nr:U-box domain-containing protein 30-like [Iris pallida]
MLMEGKDFRLELVSSLSLLVGILRLVDESCNETSSSSSSFKSEAPEIPFNIHIVMKERLTISLLLSSGSRYGILFLTTS